MPQKSLTQNIGYTRGQVTEAKLGTDAIAYTYDALGRVLSEKDAANRTTSYAYDDTNNEVRLTWPTGQWVDYENDSLNRLETIRNSAGAALADYTYDTLSRVTAIDYGNGASQSYTYENDGDLDTVVQNFAGTADDVTFDYAYNAAGQVTSKDLTNNAYLFTPGANATTSYTTNSLNQYTNIGGQAIGYDTKGNLTSAVAKAKADKEVTVGTPVRSKPSWDAANPAKPWRSRVARLEGETSNTLFETLEDWNRQLEHLSVDLSEPQP